MFKCKTVLMGVWLGAYKNCVKLQRRTLLRNRKNLGFTARTMEWWKGTRMNDWDNSIGLSSAKLSGWVCPWMLSGTPVHISCNILIYEKLKYPASLWSQTCWVLQNLLYLVLSVFNSRTVVLHGARGGVVVNVLCYKPAGCGLDSRLCHWNFSVT